MENSNLGTEEITKKEKKQEMEKSKTNVNKVQDQYRVVINIEANLALEEAVRKVGESYDGGIIDKSGVANYVFTHIARLISETDIKAMRHLYFDEALVLNTIARKAAKEGKLPDDLKRALREHYGIVEKERRGLNAKTAKTDPTPSLNILLIDKQPTL
jgi:hypothetical protein